MQFFKGKLGKYYNSLLVLSGLVFAAFILEFFVSDVGLSVPVFPVNLIMMVCMVLLAVAVSYLSLFKDIKSALLSRQFVVPLITIFSAVIMISGYIPQKKFLQYPILQKLGFFNITTSIPFALLVILIFMTLLIALINRLLHFKRRSFSFCLNHLGVLVVMAGGVFSAGDMVRVRLELIKNEVVWQGKMADSPSIVMDLPFALRLLDFTIDEYDPEVVVIDNEGKIVFKCGALVSNIQGKICSFHGYSIQLKEFIRDGFKVDDKFVSVSHVGTSPVANIVLLDGNGKEIREGFIVQGGSIQNTQYLKINDYYRLAFGTAQIKRFASRGTFYTPEQKIGAFFIEVNRPFNLKGWKLYQHSYDSRMGKWSNSSTIEAVKDPWFGVVYVGMVLMIVGALWQMFSKNHFVERTDE